MIGCNALIENSIMRGEGIFITIISGWIVTKLSTEEVY